MNILGLISQLIGIKTLRLTNSALGFGFVCFVLCSSDLSVFSLLFTRNGEINPDLEANDGWRRWWSCSLRSGADGFTW